MNIFQHLGLREDHRRADKKTTQLVLHWDEVNVKNKQGKAFGIQIKRDGVCALTVIIGGFATIWSRTGKYFTNSEPLTRKIDQLSMPDGVYFGEMWVEKHIASLEEFSGSVNPNRVNPLEKDSAMFPYLAKMSFFSMVSLESFKEGASQSSFMLRHSILKERFNTALSAAGFAIAHPDLDVLEYETVGIGTLTESEDVIDDVLQGYIDAGEEGIVIYDLKAGWIAGHKGYRVMKKVRGVDYDLRCIGYEQGKGKFIGLIAKLYFTWKGGKEIKASLGKGWTHPMAKDMYDKAVDGERVNSYSPDSPVGHIFQVYALDESSKGKLRLAKVGERRFDKTTSDV